MYTMGRNFINKLGNILKVFKGGKKKEFERDRDDIINITSESGIRSFDSSSQQDSVLFNKKLLFKKSKSTESLSIVTVDSGKNKVNALKRSNATCDIPSTPSKEEDIVGTKSLHRLGLLTHTNNCVFSYHAKLHDSSIWSQAIGRASEKTSSKKIESTNSSVDSENLTKGNLSISSNEIQTRTVNTEVDLELKSDKSTIAKTGYNRVVQKRTEKVLSTSSNNDDLNVKVSASSNTPNRHHNIVTVSQTPSKDCAEVSEFSSDDIRLDQILPNPTIAIPLEDKSEDLQTSESSKSTTDEQNLQVKMNVQTIKNEQGFDLLKYDLKSSGDHGDDTGSLSKDDVDPSNSTGVVIEETSCESEQKQLEIIDSFKVVSENTTEYEVVNLAQVDLFREFKTTISKMRNVLNVLDVKKSLQGMIERSLSERNIKKRTSEMIEGENISTQTAAMTFNQISTSTDNGCYNRTRNEGIMVQLSSETTSKRLKYNPKLLNNINPITKTKRRKKRGYRCKSNKLSTKVISTLSSSQDGKRKTKMKPDKPHYNKCIIYHITQHKNATDRCVGTPCHSMKEKLVIKNTFSALHFGPINEFPMLLNKHENEKKKRRELDQKLKTITSENEANEKNSHRRKSTSFLSSETSKTNNQNSCHKSKTQPSLNNGSSRENSSLTSTTANWFVFEPSPPAVAKGKPSTSEDMIFDKNRSSTQDLVSNILEEEIKTSGLKGKISSSTMNMIKDQFCDKLNGFKAKEVPDVMITVCVPLKSIVSKMKTSKNTGCGEKTLSTSGSVESERRLPLCSSYDKSVQVNASKNYVNDNLQTIPEKMTRKPSEIYEQKKILRQSLSSKRLSSFRKIFGNKSTSCSNIMNPFSNIAPKASKIYLADHSTSPYDLTSKPIEKENVQEVQEVQSTNMKEQATFNSSSFSLFREEFEPDIRFKKEGFFLNLPPNRFKRKREQISKLFDSDSSERRYFGEPKLLYHVHESSFYSTSKTDDRFSSKRILPVSSTSQEQPKIPYFPVQQIASRFNINVKPKFISFSDLPKKYDADDIPDKVQETPTRENERCELPPKPAVKNAIVNTSNEKILQDNETQCENDKCECQQCPEHGRKSTKKARRKLEAENFFHNCIDEFSVVSIPKVHFEDANEEVEVTKPKDICQKYDIRSQVNFENEKIHIEKHQKSASALSLYVDDDNYSDKLSDRTNNENMKKLQMDDNDDGDSVKQKPKGRSHHKKQHRIRIIQTSSDSNLIHVGQGEYGIQQVTDDIGPYVEKLVCRKSQEILKVESTHVDNGIIQPKKDDCLVQVNAEKSNGNANRLTGLIRDVVNLCNTSFLKSRDCIVELTLYNLIKEIILEHCSHLSEQSKHKVESILANFVKMSKQKAGDENVQIVESAIENLVKQISTEFPGKDKNQEEYLEKEGDEIKIEKLEHKHRRKHSRSKSKHRSHKQSKHHSRHREDDGEHREKRRSKEDEKNHKSKRHHKHHSDYESRCDIGRKDSEKKFRSVEGKREYLELVERLRELEEVTKQLSSVAHNQKKTQRLPLEHTDHGRKHNEVYNTSILDEPKFLAKKRMKFSLTELDKMNRYGEAPLEVNFFQTDVDPPCPPIPRNYPKLPVTKIVINLSNLKLLTRNCVSLSSTNDKEPIVITDSTEEKQKLINKIVSYGIDKGYKSRVKHSTRHFERVEKKYSRDTRSEIINKNKESFSITFHGKDKKKKHNLKEEHVKSSQSSKDYMRIKMVRKQTVTSTSEPTASDSHYSRRDREKAKMKDIHQMTKEYIKREYKLNSDLLCANIAKDLLENKCKGDQGMDYKANMDMAYQRMANFCLFRGLSRKD